jgi:hypothetical protein
MELVISLSSDLPENTPHLTKISQFMFRREHGNEPSSSINKRQGIS